jgi:hypothetical protein
MNILFIITSLLFNLIINICYLLNTTEEDYYDDFINRKWYARIYMYTWYWLTALIRTKSIGYVIRIVLGATIECLLIYSVNWFNFKESMMIWLVMVFFGGMLIAAYLCTVWESLIKHIKRRRKYYAKNSKNN